jgi:hypothetical protein
MTNVKLFLDVDGVINVFRKPNQNKTGWPELTQAECMGYIITWSPLLLQKLESLGLDLVWTTTWQEEASQFLGPTINFGTGAPWLSPVPGEAFGYPTIDWKFSAVREHVKANPGPFIWIDDEMERKHNLWSRENGGFSFRTMPSQGITPLQLLAMVEYIQSTKESSGV